MTNRIDCPSSQPGRRSSRIYGVMTGPASDKRVGYLTEALPLTQELLAKTGDMLPTEVYRIAAPCAQSACKHFNGTCSLGHRIARDLPPVVNSLPPCQIRATCRWYAEQGGMICLRCPQIATDKTNASDAEMQLADPSACKE